MAYDAVSYDSTETVIELAPEVEVLIKARELIERGWCKGRLSVTLPEGQVNYCSIGAIEKASGMRDQPYPPHPEILSNYINAINKLSVVMGDKNIGAFNDSHTKEEVLEAFDKAIKGR